MDLGSAVATEGVTGTSMEPSTAAHPGGGGSEEGEVVAASAEVEPEEDEVVAASAEVELEDALGGATAEPGGSGGTGCAGRGGDPRAGESPPAAPAERGNGMPKPEACGDFAAVPWI